MKIIISNTLGLPIYEQIKTQIKEAILSNELSNGDMLPSIRHLSAELRVSVITTNRAYEELEKEGLISPVQGKGYFVTLDKARFEEESRYRIEQLVLTAIDYCKTTGIDKNSFIEITKFLIEREF